MLRVEVSKMHTDEKISIGYRCTVEECTPFVGRFVKITNFRIIFRQRDSRLGIET